MNRWLLVATCLVILIWSVIFWWWNIAESQPQTVEDICKKVYSKSLPREYRKPYSVPNLFTTSECKWIIETADKYANANGWETQRHKDYPTVDVEIDDRTPELKKTVFSLISERITPIIEEKYNIPKGIIGITEAFVIKYDMNGQRQLAPHLDGSEFSFIIMLNDEYEGGGTYFVNEEIFVGKGSPGTVVIFCGQNKHMARPITSGTRYILAGFMNLGYEDICLKYQRKT